MNRGPSNFFKILSKEYLEYVPLYCTGYPEFQFIENYINKYQIYPDKNDIILNGKNYSIIKQMGFDAISIWDYRKGKGGYTLKKNLRVDGWGRIYRENWYLWDGVFKSSEIIDNWSHLNLPSSKDLSYLKEFLKKIKNQIDIVLSLPGIFEKTWQSMGFIFFSKCIRHYNYGFLQKVSNFFSEYIKKLVLTLQKSGVNMFLIADDCGYKNREFIPKTLWKQLFFQNYLDITNMIHKKNHKAILHSDGYISNFIDLFIDAGFDAIQSLEPSAGVDIFTLFKQYRNKICFIGNLDIAFLIYGNPYEIKEYIIKLVSKAKESNSPLIISPTQQINSAIKPENIKIMIEVSKSV